MERAWIGAPLAGDTNLTFVRYFAAKSMSPVEEYDPLNPRNAVDPV
jgi:hypothetical protein